MVKYKPLALFITTCVIAFIVLATVTDISNRARFNSWLRDCYKVKGTIGLTEVFTSGDRYECFINGKQVTLPGWEGY